MEETKKYFAKKGLIVYLVYFFLIAGIGVFSFLINKHYVFIILTVLFSLLFILFTLSVLNTYYVLKEDYILVVSGIFRKKIYYHRILDIKKCKSFRSSLCLAVNRIKISTGKNFMFDEFVAPIEIDEMFDEINNRVIFYKTLKKSLGDINE